MSNIAQAVALYGPRGLAVPVEPRRREFPAGKTAEKASLTAWVAVLASMIGAFMAILNIQITNASLLDIEGGIGTGVDNGAWISTSYLIGEIVVIPLTDYLSKVFSFRRYIIGNTILFALFSMACAFARDLPSMIAMRGLQGFAGGVLIPMAFTMVLTKLPKAQQPIGLAAFALAVTFAPAIGPTIGGYLTENYGWQTIFFVNTAPSAVMVIALAFTLVREPMKLSLLKEGDWVGIITMAIGLSALQTVLEEGNKDDWFDSPFILRLAIVAAVFLSAFVAIELNVRKPLLNLRLLKSRNFGTGVLVNILMGFALFGTVYVLPQYLGQVHRYNAEQIGNVLAWTGLPQLLLIPLVPLLMKRLDALYRRARPRVFRGKQLHEHHPFTRYRRRPAVDPEYRARGGPGADARADQRHNHGRHQPKRRRHGLRAVQHAAQPRRRRRHGHPRNRAHQARTVPLEHHWAVGNALSRGGKTAHRRLDELLPVARHLRPRDREAPSDCGHRQHRQTPGTHHGIQRYLRSHWRNLGDCAFALLLTRKVKPGAGAGAH
jgi:MFS family permease